jgi:ammonium transporter, Amt family
MFGYDDALDAFGVPAVGPVLTGVFAIEQYGGTAGLIEGNMAQVFNQIEDVAIVFVYDAIVSLIILKLIDWTIGLRVARETEIEGLDFTLHGKIVQ